MIEDVIKAYVEDPGRFPAVLSQYVRHLINTYNSDPQSLLTELFRALLVGSAMTMDDVSDFPRLDRPHHWLVGLLLQAGSVVGLALTLPKLQEHVLRQERRRQNKHSTNAVNKLGEQNPAPPGKKPNNLHEAEARKPSNKRSTGAVSIREAENPKDTGRSLGGVQWATPRQ